MAAGSTLQARSRESSLVGLPALTWPLLFLAEKTHCLAAPIYAL
jgi:hypothetical protein